LIDVMKFVGSCISSSLIFMMKVMVWFLVIDTYMVMNPFILIVSVLGLVELTLVTMVSFEVLLYIFHGISYTILLVDVWWCCHDRIRKWKQRLGLPQVGENEIRAMQTGDFSNALKCTGCWPSVLFIKKLECWWFKVTWHSVCVLADNPVCFLSKNLECRWLKTQVTAPRKCPSIVCHFDFTEGYHCSWRMCYWKPHYSPQLIVNKRVFEGWIQGTRLTPSLQIYNDHRTRLWQLGKEPIAVKL
jgi:hypothetical protein